jgi:hypothetical protein
MAEIAAQGLVIEARAHLLIVRSGIGEVLHDGLHAHDAEPGDYVLIYDDGQVEVKNRPPRLPENVKEIALPMTVETDGPDS